MNNKKSLSINAFLNGFKSVLGILFPLITLPYATRILKVDNMGKVNFSYSIINYFLLIAGLGISSYATREGAKIRNNKVKFEKFSNEVFSINIISTFISYVLLIVTYFSISKLHFYTGLLVIQSFNIIFTTIGLNWVFQVYEDYVYITIRTLFIQIVSLLLLFLLVHKTDDYYLYAAITVIANGGANIYNFIYARKYCKLRLVINKDMITHLIPILVFFASNIAVLIYVDSDTTMLGLMCGGDSDYYVGLYSIAVKVYTILKTLISSVTIVALPRLTYYFAQKQENDFKNSLGQMMNYLFVIMLPICVGLYVSSDEIVYILGGQDYLPASMTLRILSISLVFSSIGMTFTNVILLPMNMEKNVLLATGVSAGANIIMNFFLIGLFKQNGAAIATVCSEIVVCVILFLSAVKKVKVILNVSDILKDILGCVVIVVIANIINALDFNYYISCILKVIICVTAYFSIIVVTKHTESQRLLDIMKNKVYLRNRT